MRSTTALATAAALGLFAAPSVAFASDLTFHDITHTSFVNMGPGPDGRIGTEDDDDFASDPDLGALDLNGEGSASWIFAFDLPFNIPGGSNEFLQFSDGTSSVRWLGVPTLDEGGLIDVFAFRATDDLSGSEIFDVPDRLPHWFFVSEGGFFSFAYTIRTCPPSTTDLDDCEQNVLETDTEGTGWVWPVDTDPRDLPFIDQFPIAGLPEYMEFLATLTPPETTMLSLAWIAPFELTEDNTRGDAAALSIGGMYTAFIGGYSTDPVPSGCPEPADLCGRNAVLEMVEKLKVGKDKDKDKTSIEVEFGPGTWLGRTDDGRYTAGKWKRTGKKKRNVKLIFGDGSPLSSLSDSASAIAAGLFGEEAPSEVPAPKKIVLELNKKSSVVKPSSASKSSKLRVGRKDRKAKYSTAIEGTIADAPDPEL